ncbi:MAG: hypothetical protein L0Z53_10675 [Acidobacteriales bacterium]|nr:hypothetical protein [Terriglobales bacterium]
MAKTKRYWWLIERRHLEEQPVSNVLDMLRYDAAQVECNPPSDFYLFSSERTPTVERWASFGIQLAFPGPWSKSQ